MQEVNVKTSTLVRCLVLVALFAMVASAADVTGKWKAQVPGRDGQMRETVFTFKVDGDNLTGTVAGGRGGDAPISEGKVSGDDISFAVVRAFNEKKIKTIYKGKLSGDEIKFNVSVEGTDRNFEVTAKKSS